MEGWNITWPSMPNTTPMESHKYQELMNSQEKLITIKEIFLDIGKQMLETSYTLSLGEMLEIVLKLNKYLWPKLKLEKIQNVSKSTIENQVGSLVLEVRTTIVAINNHMVVI
jgi:hypothetical protein